MTRMKEAFERTIPPELKATIESNPAAGELLAKMVDAADTVVGPWLLRAEAAQLQKQAAAKLDEADLLEQAAALEAVRKKADEAAWDVAHEVDRLEFAVRDAIVEERAAEDRARAAVENHRVAAEAERMAQQDHADPRTQTDALLKVRAAADVATREKAAHEGAQAARVQAEQALAAARVRLAQAEDVERVAIAAVENPPPLLPGHLTLMLDGVRRVVSRETAGWGDEQYGTVEWVVESLAGTLGVDKVFMDRGRKAMEREIAERRSALIMPPPGHSLRPSDPGLIVPPPGVAPIAPRIG